LAIEEGAARPALRLGKMHNTPSQAKRKQRTAACREAVLPGAVLAGSFNFGVVLRVK
jgi:hypothetical protein